MLADKRQEPKKGAYWAKREAPDFSDGEKGAISGNSPQFLATAADQSYEAEEAGLKRARGRG